jgi:hypothetical protein
MRIHRLFGFSVVALLVIAITVLNGVPAYAAISGGGPIIFRVEFRPLGDRFDCSIASISASASSLDDASVIAQPRERCSYVSPVAAPDGRIAVIQNFPSHQLLILSSIGTVLAVFDETVLGGSFSAPAWSPDGSKLAFGRVSGPTLVHELCVINADGTGLKVVGPETFGKPAWSPDGTKIAFADDTTGGISYVKEDGTGYTQVTIQTDRGADIDPSWSPDGKQIVFNAAGYGLFRVDVDGKTPNLNLQQLPVGGTEPSWSPDGTLIAFNNTDPDIAVMSPDGTGVRQLTNCDCAMNPTWSGVVPPPPTLTLIIGDASVAEGDSGQTTATFNVTLSAPSNQTVSVDFSTVPGTATEFEDYMPVSAPLKFTPSETQKTITVFVNGDTLNELDETFFVKLSNPVGATLSQPQGGHGTIRNDDPLPTVAVDDEIKTEGNAGSVTALVTVRLSAESGQQVTVDIDTADGDAVASIDYVPLSLHTPITFQPRKGGLSGETRATVAVPIIPNTVLQSNRKFFVNLTSAVNATIGRPQGVVTIVDDDGNTTNGPGVVVKPIDTTSGATPVTITFDLVTQAGNTILTTSTTGPPSPSGFQLGNPPTYFDLETTALFHQATICIDYSAVALTGPPLLLHYDKTLQAWVNATLFFDPFSKKVCGVVTSLSPFAVFSLSNRPPIAQCHDVKTSAGDSCNAAVTAADLDNGSLDPDGDTIALGLTPTGPFPLGSFPVRLTVTDSKGASSSCNAMVMVVDTTPPSITCPPPMTVEFGDEHGANVVFTPSANDTCGAATTSSVPPSGSTFPIGTTTVNSVATDGSGNHAACSFTVTVVGALGVEQNVLGEMMALHSPDLDHAIADLQRAVDSSLWIDQTHVRDASVFQADKDAVNKLLHGEPALLDFVNRIVKADRLLCSVAINEAAPNSKAMDLRAKGDSMAAAGQYEAAIEQYRNAWSKATSH